VINHQHSRTGESPLYTAAANGHIQMVKLLLDNGADSTITRHDGTPPWEVTEDEIICKMLVVSELP